MQQAIPLCLDQNTLSVLLSMVASTHDVDLCVFSCKTCYITYFSAECFYTKILAWKCLEYIILNNPWPKFRRTDRGRTFIPANQMNAGVQDLISALNLTCWRWLSLNRYRLVHSKVEIKLFQVCLLLHMLIPSWTGLFLSGIKTCYLHFSRDSRICHAQECLGLQLDLMRLSFNQV